MADTSASNNDDHSKYMRGDILSLLSATFYGLYAVILKTKVPEEKEDDFEFSYFLGFVGLFNTVGLLPLFPIFNYTGYEIFEWPSMYVVKGLTINAILGTVISDYCWAKSVVLLGPLLTTLGITLTIPISMVFDAFYE
jgi:solute carrier family 35 protein F5